MLTLGGRFKNRALRVSVGKIRSKAHQTAYLKKHASFKKKIITSFLKLIALGILKTFKQLDLSGFQPFKISRPVDAKTCFS